ncbi:MAG: winged helix DNA-binding domain-containing protein [Actinobacteria bacterium]|nr:winged helix DNA-binding domain-containing protein [Actinomycetota bacterium]
MDALTVAHWRMHNLRLLGESLEAPDDVVGWLGAVQSQDYAPAKWSIARRTNDACDAALDQAFADGTILRTHVLRPTWHFVLPTDIRWMLELTAPRVHIMNSHQYRKLGLDAAVLEKCTSLLVDALRGGNRLTRKELAGMLTSAGVAIHGFRLAYVLMNAELNAVICSGPLIGKQHSYALLEERAPQARSLSYAESLAELTLRYFTGHGPATAKDFRWWSSLTLAAIKEGIEMVGSRLECENIDGVHYWHVSSDLRGEVDCPTVHLLQGYDEYIVGYSESKYVLDVSGEARARSGSGTVFNGVVFLDGQVAGTGSALSKRSRLLSRWLSSLHSTTLKPGPLKPLRASSDAFWASPPPW